MNLFRDRLDLDTNFLGKIVPNFVLALMMSLTWELFEYLPCVKSSARCQEHNNEKVFAFPELSVGMWGWCEGERNSRTSWVKCVGDEVGGHNQGICFV